MVRGAVRWGVGFPLLCLTWAVIGLAVGVALVGGVLGVILGTVTHKWLTAWE